MRCFVYSNWEAIWEGYESRSASVFVDGQEGFEGGLGEKQFPVLRSWFSGLGSQVLSSCLKVQQLPSGHVSNTLRRLSRPPRILVLMVPNGSPVLAAISV